MDGRVPRRFLVFGAAAALLLLGAPPAESVPSGFNVQGRLTDANGINRQGSYAIEFAIFGASEGGTLLWKKTFDGRTVGGKTFAPINVRNGNFQINLGDPPNQDSPNQRLGAVFAAGDAQFLEITVRSGPGVSSPEPPLVPRQQLVSVPFAFKAQVAEQVAQSPLPPGTVLPYGAEVPPAGFLECNGAAVSRTTYAGLFAVIDERFGKGDGAATFNLPDLRGNFIRGWDHGAGRDPDAASRAAPAPGGKSGDSVGSFQQDEFKEHAHEYIQLRVVGSIAQTSANIGGAPSQTGPAGGNETRPKNVYLMYIIKF